MTCRTHVLTVLLTLLIPQSVAAADKFVMPETASVRHVAITFDDLPAARISFPPDLLVDAAKFRRVNEKMLKRLSKLGVPIAGFVTSDYRPPSWNDADMRDLLETWMKAGATLANHTSSHRDYGETSRKDFFASINEGQDYLEQMVGKSPVANRYFRTPYLHRGDTAEARDKLLKFLQLHRYRMVPVTIDLQDWIFAEIYAWAGSKRDLQMQDATAQAYLAYLKAAIEHYALLSNSVTGREIPHIALLHASALNYDHIEAVIKEFQNREFRFIDMESALQDEAYAEPPILSGSSIRSWQAQRQLPETNPPDPMSFLGDLYSRYQEGR